MDDLPEMKKLNALSAFRTYKIIRILWSKRGQGLDKYAFDCYFDAVG